MNDPMEAIIADALTSAGIAFVREDDPAALDLDFYLPDVGIHIEVKRFHSDRISAQMARAPNVIAVQGKKAVEWLAGVIAGGNHG